jgi:hypothetical protein
MPRLIRANSCRRFGPRAGTERRLVDQSRSEALTGIIGARRANISADRFEYELAAVSSEHIAGPVTSSVGDRHPGRPEPDRGPRRRHTGMEVTQTMRKLRRARDTDTQRRLASRSADR